jgi:type II secretory pathway predicted ATPase ExeA
MTRETFKFRYPPFSDTFEVREPFFSRQDKALLKRAESFISQGKSLCLYGEPGVGKSMLLKSLMERLDPKTYLSAYIPYAGLKRSALMRELCEELGIDTSGRKTLIRRLAKHFVQQREKGFPVIIIDDAHAMEQDSFMDLCALLHDGKSRTASASLILCGHGNLKKLMNLDIFSPIRTRMAFMFRVARLDAEESANFIRHRLKIAEAPENIIQDDALAILSADANGNRRELMNRCAMAMELAEERNEKLITPDLVNSMELAA